VLGAATEALGQTRSKELRHQELNWLTLAAKSLARDRRSIVVQGATAAACWDERVAAGGGEERERMEHQ